MADPPAQKLKSIFSRLGYKKTDTASDTRDVLLIIAALITAVTFQAGVNPPGGVWQEDDDESGQKAGCAVYASQKGPFYAFLTFNTLALSTSILVLISVTCRFPFRFEVWVATSSMFATYASAIFAIAPAESVDYRYLLITAAAPFIVRIVFEVFKRSRKPIPAAAPEPSPHAP